MIGPYVVGEQPTAPMSITIGDSAGVPLDLSVYSSVEIESEPDLPAGNLDVSTDPAYPGQVQYTFSEPFTEAGTYKFRLKMSNASGAMDYTPWLQFDVRSSVDDQDYLVTPDDVFRTTGIPVSVVEIAKASSLMGLYLDRDMSDGAWIDSLSDADERRLSTALSYWSASMVDTAATASATTNAMLAGLPSNVRSISLGDQSISLSGGSNGSDGSSGTSGGLKPPDLALVALNQLSWLKVGIGTIYAAPFLTEYGQGTTVDMAMAFYHPIVNPPPTDDQLWTVIWEEEG